MAFLLRLTDHARSNADLRDYGLERYSAGATAAVARREIILYREIRALLSFLGTCTRLLDRDLLADLVI